MECTLQGGLFSRATSERTRGHCLRLCRWGSRLDTRRNFSTERVVKYWDGLPGEAVQSPSLIMFMNDPDVVLSAVVVFYTGQGLDAMISEVSPNHTDSLLSSPSTERLRGPSPGRCRRHAVASHGGRGGAASPRPGQGRPQPAFRPSPWAGRKGRRRRRHRHGRLLSVPGSGLWRRR